MVLFTFSLNTNHSHLIITTPTDVYALPYLGLSFGTPQGPSGDEQVTFQSNGHDMVSVRIMQSNLVGATWQLRIADLIANYLYMPVGSSAGSVTSIDVSGGTTGLTFTGGPVTTSGVITEGGTLNATHGGTGQTTYATGDILYASAANTLSKLPVGSNTQVLTLAAGVPSWATPAAAGVTTVGANVAGTANSASITGSTLNIAQAAPTTRGVVYGYGDSGSTATAVGYDAMSANKNARCVAVGYQALKSLTSGTDNLGVGYLAGTAITSGTYNSCEGQAAGYQITSGIWNSAFGSASLVNHTTGNYNCGFGVNTGFGWAGDTTNSVAMGVNAAGHATTNYTISNSIYIGYNSKVSGAVDREYVFGTGITGSGSNTYTLDIGAIAVDTNPTLQISAGGKLTRTSSSKRYKDPLPDPPVAQFVRYLNQLQPRAFTFKDDPAKAPRIGYYAEEVEAIRGPLGNPVFAGLLHYALVPDPSKPQVEEEYWVEAPNPLDPPERRTRLVDDKTRMVEGVNYQGFVVPLIAYCKWNDARLTQIEQHLGLTPPAAVN